MARGKNHQFEDCPIKRGKEKVVRDPAMIDCRVCQFVNDKHGGVMLLGVCFGLEWSVANLDTVNEVVASSSTKLEAFRRLLEREDIASGLNADLYEPYLLKDK